MCVQAKYALQISLQCTVRAVRQPINILKFSPGSIFGTVIVDIADETDISE
jgi:hypothetical protein